MKIENVKDDNDICERRAYRSPTLSTFGAVADLTKQGGNGPASDSGMNAMAPS